MPRMVIGWAKVSESSQVLNQRTGISASWWSPSVGSQQILAGLRLFDA